ncbi:hypothetical protein D0Y65_028301 [Glycine soja]|uniref:Strictosidine synthase conserved region domain-containing protein n=1 Tax=Glycine soja TaxID=3848 RepID=A0A445ITQ9_GLYSO|nr:hypothetical protein D0Y65_028301 [Glycine soja]
MKLSFAIAMNFSNAIEPEARSHGQVFKYNPTSNETVIFLDNVAFANGVALSKDEDYLVMHTAQQCNSVIFITTNN